MIRFAKERLDRSGSFLGVVLRNAWEQMMDDVEVGDVMHEVLATEAQASVDGSCGTFQECPCFWFVFWYLGMGVV